jgi:hypothetical protein
MFHAFAPSHASAPRRLILAVLVATLVVALGSPGCDKKGTTNPDGGGGGGAKTGAGVELRYDATARTLKQKSELELNVTGGGQFGQASVGLASTLQTAPQGQSIKVTWKIDSVEKLELKGMFKSKDAKDDPKAFLVERGAGAFLTDLRGELDDAATDALPENAQRKKEMEDLAKDMDAKRKAGEEVSVSAGVQILAALSGALALPQLPEKALEVGKAVTVEEQDKADLGDTGITVPMDRESKFTLVKIDESSGKRIAEVEFEVTSSGATDMQGQMLTVDGSNEGRLLFNLDDHTPVSYEVTASQSFAFGEQTFESTTMIKASYEAGGA